MSNCVYYAFVFSTNTLIMKRKQTHEAGQVQHIFKVKSQASHKKFSSVVTYTPNTWQHTTGSQKCVCGMNYQCTCVYRPQLESIFQQENASILHGPCLPHVFFLHSPYHWFSEFHYHISNIQENLLLYSCFDLYNSCYFMIMLIMFYLQLVCLLATLLDIQTICPQVFVGF